MYAFYILVKVIVLLVTKHLSPTSLHFLKAGASIYSYKDGFMHAKIVLVDDKIATIGTANMDVRSFELNYEIISVLYESETVHNIKRDFEEDFKHSTEIKWNAFQKRSIKNEY